MKLKFKLFMAFGAIILIFIGITTFIVIYLMQTADTIELIVEKKFVTEKYVNESYQIVLAIHADIWDIMLFSIDQREQAIEQHQSNAKVVYANIRALKENIPEHEQTLENFKMAFQYYFQFGSVILGFKDLEEFKKSIDVVNKFKENKNNLTNILNDIVDTSKKDFGNSLVGLNQSFRDIAFATTILVLAIIVLSSILAIVFAGRLTGPITYLTSVAQKVAAGDYKIRSQVKVKGEIKVLSDTFNNMLGQIQAYSEEMEDLVAQRTEELRKSTENLNKAYNVMKEELRIAQRLQNSLLPQKHTMSQCKDLEIVGKYLAMEDLGGDLYDVIRISDKKWGFLIADVSGHGVAASLITAITKVSFNSSIMNCNSTAEVCSSVNMEICKLLGEMSDYDLTMFVGILDVPSGRFEFTNAAHHPAILHRKKDNQMERLHTGDGYVGLLEDMTFASGETMIQPGDRLVLFTDGIVETRNKKNEFYDSRRLLEITRRDFNKTPDEYVENVIRDVYVFSDNAPPLDDRAILCIDYKKNKK